MKTMKLLLIVAIIFSFYECGSTNFEKKTPFKIESAIYNHWSGGLPRVSGIKVEIKLLDRVTIAFDSLFFHKTHTKVEIREEKGTTFLTAHFNPSNIKKYDLILDADPKKELKNKAPELDSFPFELKENEAIISYKVGDETKYFKIENMKKIESDLY